MQQLLHMMQKITAEPNNNARVQTSNPSSQIITTDEDSADESIETGFEVNPEVNPEDGSAEHPEINSDTGSESNVKSRSDVSVSVESGAESSLVDGTGSDSESSAEVSVESDAESSLVDSSGSYSESIAEVSVEAGSNAKPEANVEESSDSSSAQVTNNIAEISTEPQLPVSVEVQNEVVETAPTTKTNDSELVSADNDVVGSSGDEFSENDIVVDEPITPVVTKKAGFIKRWVNKAVSWVKRLVGF